MARKIRKDITVGSLEKKLKLAHGSIKNLDGRDARSDKKLGTLQKETAKAAIKTGLTKRVATPAKVKITTKTQASPKITKPATADQKSAALRKVKRSPKATQSMVKKVQAAIKNTSK